MTAGNCLGSQTGAGAPQRGRYGPEMKSTSRSANSSRDNGNPLRMDLFIVVQHADNVGTNQREPMVECDRLALDRLESILQRSRPSCLRRINAGTRCVL